MFRGFVVNPPGLQPKRDLAWGPTPTTFEPLNKEGEATRPQGHNCIFRRHIKCGAAFEGEGLKWIRWGSRANAGQSTVGYLFQDSKEGKARTHGITVRPMMSCSSIVLNTSCDDVLLFVIH